MKRLGDDQRQTPPGLTKAQIALFVLAIILFGVFMGMREQDAAFWIRMLVGGCAFAVLLISLSAKSDDQKQERPGLTKAQIARVVLGLILFGVLLGIRGQFDSVWIRMLVAGCAGAVLAIFLLPLRNLTLTTGFPEVLPAVISQSKWMRWCAARDLPVSTAHFALETCYYGLGFRMRPGTLLVTDSELIHYSYSWRDTLQAIFEPSVRVPVPLASIREVRRLSLEFGFASLREVRRPRLGFWRRRPRMLGATLPLQKPNSAFRVVTHDEHAYDFVLQRRGDEFAQALRTRGLTIPDETVAA